MTRCLTGHDRAAVFHGFCSLCRERMGLARATLIVKAVAAGNGQTTIRRAAEAMRERFKPCTTYGGGRLR